MDASGVDSIGGGDGIVLVSFIARIVITLKELSA
jgi:hypothetical protein